MQNHNYAEILLVDHSEEDLLLIGRALQKAKLSSSIHVVRSGQEAISYLNGELQYSNRKDHPLPDLLLLDLDIPGTSAFELIRWIRQRPSLAALMVVVLAPCTDFWHLAQAYSSGADSCMVKPLDPRDLVQLGLILHWLQKTQPLRISQALLQPPHRQIHPHLHFRSSRPPPAVPPRAG